MESARRSRTRRSVMKSIGGAAAISTVGKVSGEKTSPTNKPDYDGAVSFDVMTHTAIHPGCDCGPCENMRANGGQKVSEIEVYK